jgi:pilus assembly protein CpaF
MALMSDVELPVSHLREQIAQALDLIVHMSRTSEGNRVVAKISAVEGLRSGAVLLEDIFAWQRVPRAGFRATGTLPSILRMLEERDERVDPRIFAPRHREGGERPGDSPRARPHRAPVAGIGTRSHPWPGSVRRLGSVVE